MTVLKKTWRNDISFKKETNLLQVKGLIQIIVKFRTEKYFCMFPSSNTNIFLRAHMKYCTLNIIWRYSKKERIESLYFPEGK